MKTFIAVLVVLASGASAERLRIATAGHFPPYIFNPATDTARGLDIDLLGEICRRGDFDCEWVDVAMGDAFQALARGDIDVLAGGFGYSADRDAIVDFTCPYVVFGDSTGDFVALQPEADLITARIGALDQSLYLSAMVRAKRDVRPYPTESAALNALVAGDIDVVFGSHNMLDQALSRDGFFDVGDYPTFSGGTVYGVAEDAPVLLATLDALLAEISADGTLGQLQQQWLGEDGGDVVAKCLSSPAIT